MSNETENGDKATLGRIPLKQVRVQKGAAAANPMNRLVPYLDLFSRLDDQELSRLANISVDVVLELRRQVVAIDSALSSYADLLPRLGDQELVRLTGATPKTVRFWRLCQPRLPVPRKPALDAKPNPEGVVARAAAAKATTGPVATVPRADAPAAPARAPARPSPATPAPDRQVANVPHPAAASQDPGDTAASESGTYAAPGTHTQAAASQLMGFSGDPFPGFDDGGAAFEGMPAPDETDIALDDIEGVSPEPE